MSDHETDPAFQTDAERAAAVKRRYVVIMFELGGARRSRECGVLAQNERDARRRGVVKFYGESACWAADSGLGDSYGQVVGRGGNCLTDRVRVDVGLASDVVRTVSHGSGWVA